MDIRYVVNFKLIRDGKNAFCNVNQFVIILASNGERSRTVLLKVGEPQERECSRPVILKTGSK